MSTVYEHARSLVKALREGEESRQMRRLAKKVKADKRLEALLTDFRKRQFAVQTAQMQAGRLDRETAQKLEQLARGLEREALLHQYLQAEAAYGQVLMEVQEVLAEVFNPEVPGALESPKQGH